MSEWTEYHPGLDWPECDNVKWEVNLQGEWSPTADPKNSWDSGYRVRYCKCEPEMLKLVFHADGSMSYSAIHGLLPEWVKLAAPIAAYHKDMRYMVCDKYGKVYICKVIPKPNDPDWEIHGASVIIAFIPYKVIPDDWETAIVELVHEDGE
jgi:hypothetical protein